MRATSVRRKAPNRSKYRGVPTKTVVKRHDYTGEGPSFVCGECAAVVSSVRPTHAPGGGKSYPWSRCGELEVAADPDFVSLSADEAARHGLVTLAQVAESLGQKQTTVRRFATLYFFPRPVGRLSSVGAGTLYDARQVRKIIAKHRPKWVAS